MNHRNGRVGPRKVQFSTDHKDRMVMQLAALGKPAHYTKAPNAGRE